MYILQCWGIYILAINTNINRLNIKHLHEIFFMQGLDLEKDMIYFFLKLASTSVLDSLRNKKY